MLAKRFPTILPELTLDEALETTKIHSVAGHLPSDTALIATRPFRSPHHTISDAGLIGGGHVPKPGEVSLAHYGVLFLDELPEFRKNVLEVMRQPMEDGRVYFPCRSFDYISGCLHADRCHESLPVRVVYRFKKRVPLHAFADPEVSF